PLTGRIEETKRLDLVSEELGAHGHRSNRREDVDDPAAETPLPDPNDGLDALVSGPVEQLEQVLTGDAVSDREVGRARAELGRRQERRHQRGGRRDDARRVALKESRATERLLGGLLPMAAPPRSGFLWREFEDSPLRGLVSAFGRRRPRREEIAEVQRRP